jgi:hypothetical protein
MPLEPQPVSPRALTEKQRTRAPDPLRPGRGSYDREHANRFWRVLLQADRVLNQFRRVFAASAVRCTSSGAIATSRLPVFPAARRHRIRAACPAVGTTGCLFARVQQLRVLAWRRGEPGTGLLLVRFALRGDSPITVAGGDPPRIRAVDVRGGGDLGEMGPRRARS